MDNLNYIFHINNKLYFLTENNILHIVFYKMRKLRERFYEREN